MGGSRRAFDGDVAIAWKSGGDEAVEIMAKGPICAVDKATIFDDMDVARSL